MFAMLKKGFAAVKKAVASGIAFVKEHLGAIIFGF